MTDASDNPLVGHKTCHSPSDTMMKLIPSLLVVFFAYTYCQRENVLSQKLLANSPIMQLKKTVDKKLCEEKDYTEDVVKKIEDCDQFDPHYKIDVINSWSH